MLSPGLVRFWAMMIERLLTTLLIASMRMFPVSVGGLSLMLLSVIPSICLIISTSEAPQRFFSFIEMARQNLVFDTEDWRSQHRFVTGMYSSITQTRDTHTGYSRQRKRQQIYLKKAQDKRQSGR